MILVAHSGGHRSVFSSDHEINMNTVRLGIIGMGNIGKYHADYLSNKKVSRCELVAVCDAVAPLDRYKPLKTSTDGEALIRSGQVDAQA